MPETEILSKLFLELSQFTQAKTARELSLEESLHRWQAYADLCRDIIISGRREAVPSFEVYVEQMGWTVLSTDLRQSATPTSERRQS